MFLTVVDDTEVVPDVFFYDVWEETRGAIFSQGDYGCRLMLRRELRH